MAITDRRYELKGDCMIGEILTGILAWIGGLTVLITVAAVLWIGVIGRKHEKQ
ncbi:MAG: hypothetical protein IJK29_10975 [Bacteroidales bacterium]|nr:hypothetical protein [Bacteroidales bacterium]